MRQLDLETFNELLAQSNIKPRLKRGIRFVKSTEFLQPDDWQDYELLTIKDRNDNKGILVVALKDELYLLPYELKRGITSSTGKAQSIICDFCRTWQTGSRSGSITFVGTKAGSSISYLCCADVLCSLHVRNKTSAAKTSRSQLREDMTIDERVDRLNRRLEEILKRMDARPVN